MKMLLLGDHLQPIRRTYERMRSYSLVTAPSPSTQPRVSLRPSLFPRSLVLSRLTLVSLLSRAQRSSSPLVLVVFIVSVVSIVSIVSAVDNVLHYYYEIHSPSLLLLVLSTGTETCSAFFSIHSNLSSFLFVLLSFSPSFSFDSCTRLLIIAC